MRWATLSALGIYKGPECVGPDPTASGLRTRGEEGPDAVCIRLSRERLPLILSQLVSQSGGSVTTADFSDTTFPDGKYFGCSDSLRISVP